MDFNYNTADKADCWYKNICNKAKCQDNVLCLRHYKMSMLMDFALLEGKQRYTVTLKPDAADLDSYKALRDIKSDINNFVKQGKNLLIYSNNTGNGKTEWSKKLLLSWLDSIWSNTDIECRGLFISMPRLMQAMKENISKPNDYFKYVNDLVNSVDLIVWDEINYKDWTQFEQDFMLNVISHRLSIGKSNIYTTNYTLPVIESKLGTRLSSRIIGSSTLIEFVGSDKRGWHNND